MENTKSKKRKTLTTAIAIILAIAMVFGGSTYAYLQANTDDVVNNFKTNQVNVDLKETTGNEYNIIPGTSQAKDPTVTVTTTIPAYIYIEVTDTTDNLIEYNIAEGWLQLDGYDNVYYREADSDVSFPVLENNSVSYSENLTNSDMVIQNADGTYSLKDGITLSFKALAIQQNGFENADEAYRYLSPDIQFNTNYLNHYLAYDSSYIYSGGRNSIEKIDSRNQKTLCKYIIPTNSSAESTYLFTGLEIKGDYLYACTRQEVAGMSYDEDNKTIGDLYIFNKDDLTLVNQIDLGWKGSRIIIHNNLMMINLQMKGYKLYDISNPIEPSLIYSHSIEGTEEYQDGKFLDLNNHIYYISSGFGFGLYIDDLTETINSNGNIAPERIGAFKLSWYGADNLKNNIHFYDLIIDYPYIYTTVASTAASDIATANDIRGIFKVNIEDIISCSQRGDWGKIPYSIIQIPDNNKCYENVIADIKPTRMVRYGDYLITNTGITGLAVFDISSDTPTFVKLISTNNNEVTPLLITSDGKLIGGTGVNSNSYEIFIFNCKKLFS